MSDSRPHVDPATEPAATEQDPARTTGGPRSAEGASPGRDHRWVILAVIGVAQLMIVLDVTVMNIALPSAQSALGFGTTSRQWVITAYSLAFGSLLLLGGRLSDLIGRRRTLLIGLLGFATVSAIGGASTGFAMLVTARAAQGMFAAVLAPAALSTLNVTFTDAQERARAFAVYAGIAAGGSVVGLLVGGMLTEWLSWRWCLYVNLVFALPAAAGTLAYVTARERASRRVRIDWPGVITVSGGLFCLVYALSNAETDSWSAPLTIALLAASAVLLTAFVVAESRVSAPLLPLRVLADRNRAGSYLAIAFSFASMFGAFLFLTYFLQRSLDYSPLRTGVAFLPLTAGIMITAGAANTKLVPRFGPRPLVPVGMLIGAAGMAWLAQLSPTSSYAGNVVGPIFILGLGMGLAFAPAINTATAGVAAADAGVGSAMVNTSQQIGGAIGTAALSTIFSAALTRYLTSHLARIRSHPAGGKPPSHDLIIHLQEAAAVHGYTVAFAVSCGLFLAGMVLTGLLLRSGPLEHTGDATAVM